MDNFLSKFSEGLKTGFIDKSVISDELYHPELLINKKNPPQKILTTIINELENCSEFFITVAFVTSGGVATLANKLRQLEDRKIPGKILVSQYLNFTQPEALRKISKFKNIELRIATNSNFHSKGYIFKTRDYYNLIIGSSNLTDQALSTNTECNLKISALYLSGIFEKIYTEFDHNFKLGELVTEDFIQKYEEIYNRQLLFGKHSINIENDFVNIEPNSMQKEALENLKKLRENKVTKALIISATGTGKTYLSAFDAKSFNPKKLLFVVHRLTIAKDSLITFQNVFGKEKTMGLFSGNMRELDCDFVFSTVQTISKYNHFENFSKDHFDYIIIDESHRSGAESYLRLIDYFKPKFLLGMTATPERTDGSDIFQLFDHNIAYEIRLNRAMEEEMLSPFHYYGVTDLFIDDKLIDKKSDFNLLVSQERVDRIIEKAKFYGSYNGITRGLVFCSRKDEAKELSSQFNKRGLRTIALTSDSNELERAYAIEKLESDDLSGRLDYIFTVDIFNEGIDIPKINQIIMLRPTESAIIFIQQLGRGLRKIEGKDYLAVIDFIGNYENNYLIPIALYGDTSYNKDSLRKLISEGSRMIPGVSTVNFDEITKDRIFKSIDSANMQLLADLKKDYNLLKYKLGKTPMMMDFIEHGSRDPFLYVDYSKSYFNFVSKYDNEFNHTLTDKSIKILELFSNEINNSKRVEESLLLKKIIENNSYSADDFKKFVKHNYGYEISDVTIFSCINNINFGFVREKKEGKLLSVKEIYDIHVIKYENFKFILENDFQELLEQQEFKTYLLDSIDYSINSFNKKFDLSHWVDGFLIYRKYSRKDVFRILNLSENPVAQNVGGYLVDPGNKHCPIFVNYHKEDHISESIKYEDEFINNKEFDWMSKSKRKLDSSDVKSILGANGKIRLPLFIKKSNDEGNDFYYMGDVTPDLGKVEQTTMKNDSGEKVPVVKIRFKLDIPVSSVMYNYLRENIRSKKQNIKTTKATLEQIEINNLENVIQIKNSIPLYNFYAAAGSFSEMQENKEFSLIDVPEKYNSDRGYFACKIVGESMNRVIQNGSICLFKTYSGGSRNGKIVLVENFDIQDPDFNSAFTIKTYSSHKKFKGDSWEHTSIVLKPNSYDDKYKDIVIDKDKAECMRVVGEFIKVLS